MKFFSSTRYTPQQLQNIAIDLFCDVLGSILSAIGIYTFAKLASFAPGGISGVALILNHLWNLPIGTTSLVINIPLILLSYRIVGRKFMIKSIRTILRFQSLILRVWACAAIAERTTSIPLTRLRF